MKRAFLAGLVLIAVAGAALGAEVWGRYVNARYGYGIDLPPGFSEIQEAGNGDGGTSRSADGKAGLAVWGSNLLFDGLAADVQDRIESDVNDEWDVSYQRVNNKAASWSGERDGRIFYARAVLLCHDDEAGYFRIEYPSEDRDAYDGIIKRLVREFSGTDCS